MNAISKNKNGWIIGKYEVVEDYTLPDRYYGPDYEGERKLTTFNVVVTLDFGDGTESPRSYITSVKHDGKELYSGGDLNGGDFDKCIESIHALSGAERGEFWPCSDLERIEKSALYEFGRNTQEDQP
jgi:hypothetical protein